MRLILVAGLALAGCGTTAMGPAVQREDGAAIPSTGGADGGAGTGDTADAGLASAKQIIADFEAAPLARDRAEQKLGVTLQPVPDQAFPISTGTVAGGGPFSEVEFREASKMLLLILTVRPGVTLPLEGFIGDVIPPGTAPGFNPAVPPEGVESYTVARAARETAFEFGATSKSLRTVTFKQPR